MSAGHLTEKQVFNALTDCRGDILQSAKLCKMSVREFDNVLRAIPGSAVFLGAIEEIKADNPQWEKASTQWFESQCRRAMSLYRLTAMEELYSLATMPVNANAAMMNVKREAALNLLGRDRDGGETFPELATFFAGLNEDYKKQSVRVTEVRTRLVELRGGEMDITPVSIQEALPQTPLPVPAAPEPPRARPHKKKSLA